MSNKHLLKFGIPTIGVILIIIGIALFAGRDPKSPKVSSPNETVFEFLGLKYTKQELYDKMKANYGLYTVLDEFDSFLLKDYEEKIDEEKVKTDIKTQKDRIGEEGFYDQFVSLGIYQKEGETKEDLDQKIFDYFKLQEIKRVYAKDQVVVSDATIQKQFDEYREDVCVIPLTFPNKDAYNAFYDKLKDKSDADVVNDFKNEYLEQQKDKKADDEEKDYLDEDFDCEYERVVYSEARANYRNFIYNDLVAMSKLNTGESIKGKSYNETAKMIDNTYYVVLKLDEANAKVNNHDELWGDIKTDLEAKQLTNNFITTQVQNLREKSSLVIYDPKLADQYNETIAEKHKVYKKSKGNNQVVAEIKGKSIKSDELYNVLKESYGASSILDKVNYLALNSVDKIQLTKSEKETIEKQITQMRKDFLDSGYAAYFTWHEYIGALYGAANQSDLFEVLAYQNYLIERYILGYKDYAGSNPLLNTEVVEEFDTWLNAADGKAYRSITASHILFKFDEFDDEGNPTAEAKERAEKLADQIINGVNDSNRIDFEEGKTNPNILFKYNATDKDAPATEFQGLFGLDEEYKFVDTFKLLAKDYSEDGSAANGGDLGSFGPTEFQQVQQGQSIPKRMVEPFEEAALNTQEGDWTEVAVETQFGIHIIYVTKKVEAPAQPADFLTLSDADLQTKIKNDTTYKTYNDFFKVLKDQVRAERLSNQSIDRELALLREELNFKFNDNAIQSHYKAMQAIYLREETEDKE